MVAGYFAGAHGALPTLPGDPGARLRQGAGPALRRKSASARGVLQEPAPAARRRSRAQMLQGKDLSFNNIADADTAIECVRQFAAGLRHRQAREPVRCRGGARRSEAYERAYRTDPTSAFGGIIAFNRELDAATAPAIIERQFVEVLAARRCRARPRSCWPPRPTCGCWCSGISPAGARRAGVPQRHRRAAGADARPRRPSKRGSRVPTRRQPDPAELGDLRFAWRVASSSSRTRSSSRATAPPSASVRAR